MMKLSPQLTCVQKRSALHKKNGVVLPVLKIAPGGHEHLYTVVAKVFVPRTPLEVLEGIARTASEEAQKV